MPKVSVTFRDGRVKMVSERDASILVRIGRASLTPETPAAPPPKSKPAAKTPRTPSDDSENTESKRVYRRRDLEAEE